jgi:hypothetical protein
MTWRTTGGAWDGLSKIQAQNGMMDPMDSGLGCLGNATALKGD